MYKNIIAFVLLGEDSDTNKNCGIFEKTITIVTKSQTQPTQSKKISHCHLTVSDYHGF